MQKGIETETRGHVTAAQMGGLHSVVSRIRCEFTRSQDSEIIGIVSCWVCCAYVILWWVFDSLWYSVMSSSELLKFLLVRKYNKFPSEAESSSDYTKNLKQSLKIHFSGAGKVGSQFYLSKPRLKAKCRITLPKWRSSTLQKTGCTRMWMQEIMPATKITTSYGKRDSLKIHSGK